MCTNVFVLLSIICSCTYIHTYIHTRIRIYVYAYDNILQYYDITTTRGTPAATALAPDNTEIIMKAENTVVTAIGQYRTH